MMATALISLAAAAGIALAPLSQLPAARRALRGAAGMASLLAGASVFLFVIAGGLAGASLSPVAWAEDARGTESPATPLAPEKPALAPRDESLHTAPNVDPETDFVVPPGRPEWVESAPVRAGQVHTTYVFSEPYHLAADARIAFDKRLQAATDEYINEQLGSSLAASLVRVDTRQIKRNLLKPEHVYEETVTYSVGPMRQVHGLLTFDENFRRELERRWEQVVATSRLLQVGLAGAGALLLLGTVFGYFRLDTATRGYYTGRLQFAAAAAILAIVASGALLSKWIPWL